MEAHYTKFAHSVKISSLSKIHLRFAWFVRMKISKISIRDEFRLLLSKQTNLKIKEGTNPGLFIASMSMTQKLKTARNPMPSQFGKQKSYKSSPQRLKTNLS